MLLTGDYDDVRKVKYLLRRYGYGLKEGAEEAPTAKEPTSGLVKPEPPQTEPAFQPDLSTASLKKVEEQKGTQPGGVYEDSTGKKWYVKTPPTIDHARNEVLAAALYKEAGVLTPETKFIDKDGALGVASSWVPDLKVDPEGLASGSVAGVREGFVVDAWLANWDVAGAGAEAPFGNMLVAQPFGGPIKIATRLDFGGALLYKGLGGEKGSAFGPTVGELESLRDPKINPSAAKIFAGVTLKDLVEGAKKVLSVSDEKIRQLVEEFGPGNKLEKQKLANTLIARKENIAWQIHSKLAQQPIKKLADWFKNTTGDETALFSAVDPHTSVWTDISPKYSRYGVVVVDKPSELVLLREVKNHYAGYAWSFAKGGAEGAEHPLTTALAETMEELGVEAAPIGIIPKTFYSDSNTGTMMYVGTLKPGGKIVDFGKETQHTKWVTYAEARQLIKQGTNKAGVVRDLKILDHVFGKARPEIGGDTAEFVYKGIPSATKAFYETGQFAEAFPELAKSINGEFENLTKLQALKVAVANKINALSPGLTDEAKHQAVLKELATVKKNFKDWSGFTFNQAISGKSHGFETGKPFVAETFHGTSKAGIKGDVVNVEKYGGSHSGASDAKLAFFTAGSKNTAKAFGSAKVYELYTTMHNPLVVDKNGHSYHGSEFVDFIREAQAKGHDGVVVMNVSDSGGTGNQFLTWDPLLVKTKELENLSYAKVPGLYKSELLPGEANREMSVEDYTRELGRVMGAGWVRRAVSSGLLEVVEGAPQGKEVSGVWDGNKIKLFAGAVPMDGTAAAVLLHEGTHAGWDQMLAKSKDYAAEIETLPSEAARDAVKQARMVADNVIGADKQGTNEWQARYRSELLGYYVQYAKDYGEQGGTFRRIINAIKAWVAQTNFGQWLSRNGLGFELTDGLAVALGKRATKFAAALGKREELPGEPLASTSIGNDLEAQVRWMTEEAKRLELAHTDPGELFTYEPEKFTDLAARWRDMHPEEVLLPSPGLEHFSVARLFEKKLGAIDRTRDRFLSPEFDRLGFFNQAYLDYIDKFGGLTKGFDRESAEFQALKQAVASRMDQAQAQRAEAIQEVQRRYQKPLLEKFHQYKDLDVEKAGLQYAARHIVEDGVNRALAEGESLEYVNRLIERVGEEDAKALEKRRIQIVNAKTKSDLTEKADIDRIATWDDKTPLTREVRQKLMKELMDEFAPKELVVEGEDIPQPLRHEWEEFKDHASGLSTGEGSNVHNVQSAIKIYEDARKDKRLGEIWALLDQANLHALDVRLATGLIDKAQYEAMRADKAFYAPLRRTPYVVEQELLADAPGAKGGSKGLRVRVGTHLPGHEPTMVIQNSLAALEATVAAGQANMARRFMADTIRKLPVDWQEWFTVGLGKEFPYYDKNGFVKHTAPSGGAQKPFDVPFYQDGKLMLIRPVESNARAMSFAAAVMNTNPYRAAGPMKLMQKANSWIRFMNVAGSPAFLLANSIRDPLTAAFNLTATEANGYVGKIFAEYGASLRALNKAYRKGGLEKLDKGEVDPDVLRVVNWQRAGGQITYAQALRQMDTTGISFEKLVTKERNELKRWGWKGLEAIENLNTMMESVMRLSTYTVLTRSKAEGGAGLSPMKASQISRDVTTNFLRKGFKSSALGAWYLFFNATVQGNRQVAVNLMKSKKLQGIVAGTVAFSFLVDQLGRAVGAEDEDGDGRNDWDQIPSWDKERNIIFPFRVGGDWAKIPAPWVYNVFWRAGQLLSEPLAGVEGKDTVGAFADIARLSATTMNPIQSGTLLQTISPTWLDPVVQVAENRDFAGRPLAPTPFPGQARADSWMSFSNTPGWAKDLAKWANAHTGGNIAKSGVVDLSPSTLEVIHDTIGGGLVRFGEQIGGALWNKAQGKETETREFPVLRQFLTAPGQYVESQLYHERIAQVQMADQAVRAYTKGSERNLLKAREVQSESAQVLRMKQPMLDAEREIKSLRLRARLAENRGDEAGTKRWQERMAAAQRRFNRVWRARVGE
jgi:8-oxo-dGTP pyrophosphatase MutT (NUDIX family)